MARSRGATTVPAPNSPSLPEVVLALTEQVKNLTDHVQVLWTAIDDIRQEFEWAVRNDRMRGTEPPMHITSMPKDPCAPDFGERINRFTPANAPEAFAVPHVTGEERSKDQRELF